MVFNAVFWHYIRVSGIELVSEWGNALAQNLLIRRFRGSKKAYSVVRRHEEEIIVLVSGRAMTGDAEIDITSLFALC